MFIKAMQSIRLRPAPGSGEEIYQPFDLAGTEPIDQVLDGAKVGHFHFFLAARATGSDRRDGCPGPCRTTPT